MSFPRIPGRRENGVKAAIATVAASLVLLTAAAACGERSEPRGAPAALYPVTITLAADRPLVIRRPAERIAVLSPGAAVILDALGARTRVAGTPIDSAGRLNDAKLRALEPDFVVAPSSAEDAVVARAARIAHAPVYVVSDDSIREVEQTIVQLGIVTAEPAGARRLVRRIEDARQRVAQRLRGRRAVSVFVDTGFFTTVSDQSLIGDLVREGRGHNVAGLAPDPGPFDLETLIRLQPRVYVTTSDSGTTLAGLRRDRKASKLKAVRAGRFAIIDSSDLELGTTIGRGLLELARAIHPDAFR